MSSTLPQGGAVAVPPAIDIHLDRAAGLLHVGFADGLKISLGAEYLRVESPSAEVQGHGASQRQWVGGKRDVRIIDVRPVGTYAVQLVFDDGHDTGLYSWALLRTLAAEQPTRWETYLANLARTGGTREPVGTRHTPS